MKESTIIKTEITKGNNGTYGLLITEEGSARKIENISNDLNALKNLSDKINRGRVSGLHIYDIIEDFLE